MLVSWQEFLRGKRKRRDIAEFYLNFLDNIIELHGELRNKIYKHGGYHSFKINDPKPRDIHKASVRDRLVHHAIYRILYPFFDRKFIHDSYSCRVSKGTHKAINRFREFGNIVSKNNNRTCWVLKCDIRKFFASVDQSILKRIISKYIPDKDVIWLLGQVIDSFSTTSPYPLLGKERCLGKIGMPLGNLTSQLFVNIYMKEFDQFVKHQIRAKYYIRYADDFVFMSDDKKILEKYLRLSDEFLKNKLKLELHKEKIQIKTINSGIDFLGWINFPYHRVLRSKTKKRMQKRLRINPKPESLASYMGLLKHGNTHGLQKQIIKVLLRKSTVAPNG